MIGNNQQLVIDNTTGEIVEDSDIQLTPRGAIIRNGTGFDAWKTKMELSLDISEQSAVWVGDLARYAVEYFILDDDRNLVKVRKDSDPPSRRSEKPSILEVASWFNYAESTMKKYLQTAERIPLAVRPLNLSIGHNLSKSHLIELSQVPKLTPPMRGKLLADAIHAIESPAQIYPDNQASVTVAEVVRRGRAIANTIPFVSPPTGRGRGEFVVYASKTITMPTTKTALTNLLDDRAYRLDGIKTENLTVEIKIYEVREE